MASRKPEHISAWIRAVLLEKRFFVAGGSPSPQPAAMKKEQVRGVRVGVPWRLCCAADSSTARGGAPLLPCQRAKSSQATGAADALMQLCCQPCARHKAWRRQHQHAMPPAAGRERHPRHCCGRPHAQAAPCHQRDGPAQVRGLLHAAATSLSCLGLLCQGARCVCAAQAQQPPPTSRAAHASLCRCLPACRPQ